MENRKLNLDRPKISSEEIQAQKNFDQVLSDYQVMSKPFYKSSWFFGTTGLASIGLIIGGSFAFQDPEQGHNDQAANLNTEAPPDLVVPDNSLISMNVNHNEQSKDLVKETLTYNESITNNADDETLPLEESQPQEESEITETEIDQPVENAISESENEQSFDAFDMNPRIGGKLNGSITKTELFDNKGITTESDVSIIHFELHLIDGLGEKMFVEEGNQLNEQMKKAIEKLGQGDEIYFEDIKGQSLDGTIVRLNPLRYVLLN